ncbi:MAG TPA: SipW-dependent-type signal peptide-containing protein [Bacillota bacterium]|nr:SipW-dependent-type signal peptide-containing protein [Bacillota bacterium]
MKMKKKTILISVLLVACFAIGVTYAWFTYAEAKENVFTMGTVDVEVEENFEEVGNAVQDQSYEKTVQVKSNGNKKTYVRVKLFPEWSNPSLPVSNVVLQLADNEDWVLHEDGYYYFKYYLTQGQCSSLLLTNVSFTELGPEYIGKFLTVKVVAEGVQTTHDAWKEVWGLDTLPFEPDQPYVPSP